MTSRGLLSVRVLGMLGRHAQMAGADIATILDEPVDKIGTTLRRMRDDGRVEVAGEDGSRVIYRITEAGRGCLQDFRHAVRPQTDTLTPGMRLREVAEVYVDCAKRALGGARVELQCCNTAQAETIAWMAQERFGEALRVETDEVTIVFTPNPSGEQRSA